MNRREFVKAGLVLMPALTSTNTVAVEGGKPWQAAVKTLVIVSHPYPERSVMTLGMQQAAEQVAGATVRNLETLYGFDTRNIDADREYQLMQQHDRVVFVFPTHWFNIPPMMKAWLNDVWGSVGPGLWAGKEMLLVTTASGGSSTYGPSGRVGVRLKDVFLPMQASAAHAGMEYLEPLAFEGFSRSRLAEYQQQLLERLQQA